MRYPGSLLAFFLASALASQFNSARAAAPSDSRLTLPVYGISFVPPNGNWIANDLPTLPNIAMYRLADAQHHLLAELDIQALETPPFERHKLDEFALTQNAEVMVQTFSIDNAPTIAVRKLKADDKCGAFLMLVADHDGRSYTFSVQASGDNAPTHDLITLVKSVKWLAPEDPLKHVAKSQNVSLFPGSQENPSIQLPTIFRRVPQNKEKYLDVFLVTDAAGKQVAALSFHFVPATEDLPGIPQDDQLLEYRRSLLATAQRRWGQPDFPFMDTKNPLDHGVITSPTVISSLSADAHVITAISRFGAIFNKPGITEVETRVFTDTNDANAAKWDQILLTVANSLRFGADATQPAATQQSPATSPAH